MSKKERKTVFEQCLLEDPANLDDYFYALGTYCATKCGGDYFTIPDPCGNNAELSEKILQFMFHTNTIL